MTVEEARKIVREFDDGAKKPSEETLFMFTEEMDSSIAWKLVKKYTNQKKLSEDERIVYEEALNYIVYYEIENIYMAWDCDVIAGAYNLGAYYEKIGKYELAKKYYLLSETYGKDSEKEDKTN